MAAAIPIYICPGAADGVAFTAWLQPCTNGALGLPNGNSVVASQIAAKNFASFWTLASKLQPVDHVWNGTSWVAVSTVVVAAAPAPTPVPVPTPTPTPTPTPPAPTSVVTLAAGQSVQVNFAGSASITIAASS